jgi:hypothetical protein
MDRVCSCNGVMRSMVRSCQAWDVFYGVLCLMYSMHGVLCDSAMY